MFSLPTLPKISIIISTYNGAKYIGETIESIRDQTYSNWELIIVDDGSDDNTCEIITSINDHRIHLHKAGRIGINGMIKNIALSKVTGELIAFIDHDDLWAPAKLEKQVIALQQYPEAGFSLTGGYNFRKKGEAVDYFYTEKEGVKIGDVFLSFFRSELAAWTQALLVRKQCIDIAGRFNEASLFADPAFIASLASHFKAIILYEPLAYHRVHETNYTTINWIKAHEDGLDVIRLYKNNKLLPGDMARHSLFRSYIHFGEKCLLYKKRRKALSSFMKAWRQKPFTIIPFKKIVKTILYSFKK